MFCSALGQRNVFAYLFWRWALRSNGPFSAWLEGFFFGPSRGMNDYDSLAVNYKKSDVKPDKQYSILPTVLDLVGDCREKVVIDVGCGTGFFTLPLAKSRASLVYGLDNSSAQLRLASEVSPHSAIKYVLSDVFSDRMAHADIVVVPFVTNYARTIQILRHFFLQIYTSLNENGRVVFVVDFPNGKDLKRFGAVKILRGLPRDETKIQISLFNVERKICELTAVYYTPETIEKLLREVGFKNICWHKPVISREGIDAMGASFWKGYLDDPELGYLTAEK